MNKKKSRFQQLGILKPYPTTDKWASGNPVTKSPQKQRIRRDIYRIRVLITLDSNQSFITQIGYLKHLGVDFIIGELRATYSLHIGFFEVFYIMDHDLGASILVPTCRHYKLPIDSLLRAKSHQIPLISTLSPFLELFTCRNKIDSTVTHNSSYVAF